MWLFVLACLGPAFLISWLATRMVCRLAPRWGLIDQPGHRKVHLQPKPLGGGIGIWLGLIIPLAGVQFCCWFILNTNLPSDWLPAELSVHLEGVVYRSGQLWLILFGMTVLSVMGLVDDFRNLGWKSKWLVQLLVALYLVFVADVRATMFLQLPWIGEALTVLWLLVLINSLNFLDNMDGLTGGIAVVASLLFAAIMLGLTSEPRWLVAGVLLMLAGSAAGFLTQNWPPSRIFMGDSGSYLIGGMLASFTVLGTFYDEDSAGRHVMLAPLFILAIPLYDFTSVMIIRLSQGRSPFQGDKCHFSHRLVDLGLKPRDAVLTVHLTTLTTGLGALLLYCVPNWFSALLICGVIACVLLIVSILEFAPRRANREAARITTETKPPA